jgi:hypothetical protein
MKSRHRSSDVGKIYFHSTVATEDREDVFVRLPVENVNAVMARINRRLRAKPSSPKAL